MYKQYMKKQYIMVTAIILLLIVIYKIVDVRISSTDENTIVYIEGRLEAKYHIDFEYKNSEYDATLERKVFYFVPEDNGDIIITTYSYYSWNAGMIQIYVPFYLHRCFGDNFKDEIKQYVLDCNNIETVDITGMTLQEATDEVHSIMTKIDEQLCYYNFELTGSSNAITLTVINNNKLYEIYFRGRDKSRIQKDIMNGIQEE